ncbi:unnamed protein product [Mytilus coruscus]|uniref:Uncharacterized protein n=1 Tax=Mytilus coruscus TaxID=42192 RepID=A0A6J8EF96_MYTCO|nr:unnamed protein product [Mytilus coruscus]
MSGNCTPTLGSDDATSSIVQLMSSFIMQAGVLGEDNDYENNNLCFLTRFHWLYESCWYTFKQYFGIPFQEFGYKCCMVRNETACCDDRLHAIEGYRVVPYVIAVILVCYFPIILMNIGNSFKPFDAQVHLRNFSSTFHCESHTQNSDDKIVSVYLSNVFVIGFSDHQYLKTSHQERIHLDPCCMCKLCSCKFKQCCTCRLQLKFDCLKVRWERIVFLTLAPVLLLRTNDIFFDSRVENYNSSNK